MAAQDANRASTPTKVYVTIYEGFGTPREKVTRKTVTLATGKKSRHGPPKTTGKAARRHGTSVGKCRICEPTAAPRLHLTAHLVLL